jgi:hypothetical protein
MNRYSGGGETLFDTVFDRFVDKDRNGDGSTFPGLRPLFLTNGSHS